MQPTPNLMQLQSLLDRLDPRLDEPCTVAGCVHLHGPLCIEHVMAELQAA